MAIWKVNAALPGLNVPFYMECEERPTHEQINAVWMGPKGSKVPLKDPTKTRDLPLRDCYPGYAGVDLIEVHQIPAVS